MTAEKRIYSLIWPIKYLPVYQALEDGRMFNYLSVPFHVSDFACIFQRFLKIFNRTLTPIAYRARMYSFGCSFLEGKSQMIKI